MSCAGCGEAVEAALSRLGSPRCHDCREAAPGLRLGAELNGDGHHRCRRARLEVQAYLRAWREAGAGAAAIVGE